MVLGQDSTGTKISLKWVKDLNIGATTIKHFKENIGINIHIGLDNGFLDNNPKSTIKKEKQ